MNRKEKLMSKHRAIALTLGGLSVLGACTTVKAPERAPLPERAGTVQPVMVVRDGGGVDSGAMYRIGRYFQGQMRYHDAIAAYRKALALDDRNIEARNALAVAYSTLGLQLESEREFKLAIAQAPDRSHLHANLGYHYLQSGRTEEAVTALHEAIRLDPANQRALNNLAAAEGRTPVAAAPEIGRPLSASEAAVGAPPPPPAQVPAPVASAPFVVSPVASIAELIGAGSVAPKAMLIGIAPNVWELRPQAEIAAVRSTPSLLRNIVQVSGALQPPGLDARIRFEIANGNGVAGLARRVGLYLRGIGMAAPRLTNQRPFDQRRTEIQYIAGMEQAAQTLRGTLGTPADLLVTRQIERNAQLRVVLGRDFQEIDAVARMRGAVAKQAALAPKLASR